MEKQKIREYNINRNRFIGYLALALIIIIPIYIYLISNLIESYKILNSYDPSVKIITDLKDGSRIFDNMMYNFDKQQNGYNVIALIIFSAAVFFILHTYLFTNVKMIIDKKGINIYSVYRKEPTKLLKWSEVTSIQLGYVHTETSRVLQYGLKIRLKYSDSYETKDFVPIRRFENYEELVKDIDQIGQLYNVEIHHMDD